MEVNEFNFTVKMFDQGGAALHPVAAVEILHIADGLDFGAVDVAANHAIGLMVARHRRQRLFVLSDVFDSGLGFEFQKRRDRPIAEAAGAAQTVEVQVEVEDPVVDVGADFFEQVIEVCEAVSLVSVRDEIFFAVGSDMNDLLRYQHAAESSVGKLFHELVVITGEVDDFGLLAAFAE